ncbi:MAG TPA: hypothetical protein VFA60_14550 [Terriglobales bacterium]|nr:hypothetical protein [Terriglobales bacterium]
MTDVERDIQSKYEPVLTLFFSGRLTGLNHARHVAVANILRRLPHGRELMHLGLRITAIRNGVREKYNEAMTDFYWDNLDGTLPGLSTFADVLAPSQNEGPCPATPDRGHEPTTAET